MTGLFLRKTLSGDLHPTQRRTQGYTTMLVAERHRTQRWPMTAADFSFASRELGHSKSSRTAAPRCLKKQLQSVSLTTKMLDLSDLLPAPEEDEPQEEGGAGGGGEDADDGSTSALIPERREVVCRAQRARRRHGRRGAMARVAHG